MIRCQELVPDYYVENSRDFQVLCRLYDYTFNALKFNIDTMQSLTNTQLVKDTVLPLVGDKFGIYDKQSYSNRELLTALPSAVHYKGSLKGVSILLNAYLDSLHIFDYAIAYHSKDEKSAKEISQLLGMKISPYTIVIVLSIAPSLVDLHVLDEYLRMVVPCGMFVEYVFGVSTQVLTKFKYNENVFIYYVNDDSTSKIARKPSEYKITVPEESSDFVKRVANNVDLSVVGLAELTRGEAD